MDRPLDIYTFVPIGAHASYYYRVKLPIETAAHMGLPVRAIVDQNIEGIVPEQRIRNFCEADVILLYQPVGDGPLNNIKMAKNFLPSLREGKWKYPPTVVIDSDDNLFRVDPFNGAFKNLGYRDPETGSEIAPGQQIAHVENGVRKVLWKDGEQDFIAARNKQAIETYREALNHADVVSCSTRRVGDAMLAEGVLPRRIRVNPNMVRFDHYPQVALERDPQKVRILWQGGANHYLDWLPLRDAVGRIVKRYPEAHFLMWGVKYDWAMELIPPDRMEFIPWCAYEEYKVRRMIMGDDINLAPLAPTRFNACRTAIKWYEASVQKRPSATLAQATGPYADEIGDGETGLLFKTPEEFEQKLGALIEDESLRRRLGSNAKDWLSEHRDAFKLVPEWLDYLIRVRDQVERDTPHMPVPAWEAFEARMRAEEEERQKQAQPKAA